MRLSAKLNVFLGVRNLTEQFVPAHLRYLRTYFRRARLNPLMPVSLLAGTIVVARLGRDALASGGTELFVVERVLVTSILALAVLEHVFLTLPVPDAVLWSWATRTRRGRQASTTEPLTDLTVEAP
jgi:putative photosynthetic complex assembly protein 2